MCVGRMGGGNVEWGSDGGKKCEWGLGRWPSWQQWPLHSPFLGLICLHSSAYSGCWNLHQGKGTNIPYGGQTSIGYSGTHAATSQEIIGIG